MSSWMFAALKAHDIGALSKIAWLLGTIMAAIPGHFVIMLKKLALRKQLRDFMKPNTGHDKTNVHEQPTVHEVSQKWSLLRKP
jgi:hypothetical protein